MTDTQTQIDPKANPYFQDTRIRRYLLKAGLINRHGDILYSSTSELPLVQSSKKPKSNNNLRTMIRDYVIEERERRQRFVRSQIDLSVKRVQVKKTKGFRHALRSMPRSTTNLDRSPTPPNKNQAPNRAKSAHHLSRDSGIQLIRRSAKDKSPVKARCRVVMIYYGPQTVIDYDKSWFPQQGDEIQVMQQHCGGENLTVFKGYVKPQETFAFDSLRHEEYPFALSIYINGLIDTRISVCCEYKHKRHVPLGGPHGSFAIVDIQQANPCLSCQYIRRRRKKKSKSVSSPDKDQSRYRKSVVPRLPTRDSSASPASQSKSKSKTPSPDLRQTPTGNQVRTPTSEEDNKKPATKRHSPKLSNGKKPKKSSSRTSKRSSDNDDKKPPISSHKKRSPSPQTRRSSDTKSPDVSRTPTPPPPPPQKPTAYITQRSPSSSEEETEKPVISPKQKLNVQITEPSKKDDNENYTSDFDDMNDENSPLTNTRFGRPRISDSNSIERDQENYNTQSKSSLNRSTSPVRQGLKSPTTSEDEQDIAKPQKDHVSTSIPNTQKPKKLNNTDEADQRFLATITSKKDNEQDRKVTLNSSDDIFGDLSVRRTEQTYNPSRVRRTSTSSTEDMFGLKRSSPAERKTNTEPFSKDWFETSNRNNQYSSAKTTSERRNFFEDDD